MLVAWNGASESARAVALALPFLHAAGEILVLEVEGGSVLGPDAQDLRTYLTRHGISSQSKTLAQDGAETGQVILDEAASFGADLIIKGAYTHSRLRQMIFGGATKLLLAAAPIPVLMAHEVLVPAALDGLSGEAQTLSQGTTAFARSRYVSLIH